MIIKYFCTIQYWTILISHRVKIISQKILRIQLFMFVIEIRIIFISLVHHICIKDSVNSFYGAWKDI